MFKGREKQNGGIGYAWINRLQLKYRALVFYLLCIPIKFAQFLLHKNKNSKLHTVTLWSHKLAKNEVVPTVGTEVDKYQKKKTRLKQAWKNAKIAFNLLGEDE